MNRSETYCVYTLKMMEYLVRQGFHVLKVEDSYENPKFKTFIFKLEPGLEKAADDFRKNLIR